MTVHSFEAREKYKDDEIRKHKYRWRPGDLARERYGMTGMTKGAIRYRKRLARAEARRALLAFITKCLEDGPDDCMRFDDVQLACWRETMLSFLDQQVEGPIRKFETQAFRAGFDPDPYKLGW